MNGTGLDHGDRVVDRDAPPEERSPARIVEQLETTADETYIGAIGKTVADANPDYEQDAAVVGVRFSEGGATYSYPAARLKPVSEDWDPPASKTAAQREREDTITRHEKRFEAFRHAVRRLAESPATAGRWLGEHYNPVIQPETRGECDNSREDSYRPDASGAIVCWECNGGGRRPKKLHADDAVPPDALCRIWGGRNPTYALKLWVGEEVVAGNEDPKLTEEVEKSITPNEEYQSLASDARKLRGEWGRERSAPDRVKRSAVLRIGYEATVGGALDEEYNHARACAYLHDLGVDTEAILPGGVCVYPEDSTAGTA